MNCCNIPVITLLVLCALAGPGCRTPPEPAPQRREPVQVETPEPEPEPEPEPQPQPRAPVRLIAPHEAVLGPRRREPTVIILR